MKFEDARARAIEYIDNLASDIALKLVEDATIERKFGWVFFYNSARYLESGSPSDAVCGNAPIIVTRDGDVHVTGTAHSIKHYIAEFERRSQVREPACQGTPSTATRISPSGRWRLWRFWGRRAGR